jgi:hypothetical protein
VAPAVLAADLGAESAGEPEVTLDFAGGAGGLVQSKAD